MASVLAVSFVGGDIVLAQSSRKKEVLKKKNTSAESDHFKGFSNSEKNMTVKKAPVAKAAPRFIYLNGYFTSFADQVFAKTSTGKEKARSIFTAFGVGFDYTLYSQRYLYGWNLNFLSGHVDVQKIQGISYPRQSFLGVHSGPEVGYRVNSDMDLSYSLGLLYRDIQSTGSSLVLSNQANIKFRFTPKLTLFQNFGNYGKPKAYSYSIGLRWLL